MRHRSRQTVLEFPTWGGKRARAGRKPANGHQAGASHLRRPDHRAAHPVHVTVRVSRAVRQLRNGKVYRVLAGAFAAASGRPGFRLVHFGVQSDHMHFLVEANDRRALATGVQGLCIRVARRVNRLLGREGKVFPERYHARALATPTEVKNCLRYVLLNQRHHASDRGGRFDRDWVDPYSSGPYFDGWKGLNRPAHRFAIGPPVTAPPGTWLLATGWRLRGLIDVAAVPGPRPRPGRG